MKNLILILSLCFCLFSCFEKEEEEITIVPKEPIEEGDIKECEAYTKFKNFAMSDLPRTPRSTIRKYVYKNQYVYSFYLGIKEDAFDEAYAYVIDSKCNLICDFSQAPLPETRCLDWDDAKYIEIIWQDPR